MIRTCEKTDFTAILSIINAAAAAYQGHIPDECWHEPYMPASQLEKEIDDGVTFWCVEEDGQTIGVMGLQNVKDATLIRHAYVRPDHQSRGIGGSLLRQLIGPATSQLFVGTWADAEWAISFYRKHGFELVRTEERDALLGTYWNIPDRQRDASVVLRFAPQNT